MRRKLLFVVNVDWFFLSHRLPIALEAMRQGYEVHIATGLTSKLDVLVGHGLIVHPLSLRRGSTAMGGVLYSIYEIYSVMRKVRPDVVHLVTIKPVLLGGLAARLAKVPSVVSAISGLGYVFLDSGVKAWVRRFFVKKIYAFSLGHHNLKVIFQNKDDQDNVSQLANLTQENSLLIRGSGVDLREYVNKPIPDGVPVVMLAARMLKDKGVQEFVDAARLLKKAEYSPANGVRCVLVGEPDLENPASLSKETLEAWGREGVVEVWGGSSDMSHTLAMSSLVVLPSYREGLPKVLIEAAACGRAVVTSDVPGCRDAIEAGVTGLLVPAKEVEPLAAAIKSLLDQPDRFAAMGQAGRELAERVFDVTSVTKCHMQLYDELIKRAAS